MTKFAKRLIAALLLLILIASVAAFVFSASRETDVAQLSLKADAAFREGREKEAFALYSDVLQHDPNATRAVIRLAEMSQSLGHVVQAEELWRRATQLDPRDRQILLHHDIAMLRTGREQALIEKLSRRYPESLAKPEQLLLANAYLRVGRLEKASALTAEILKEDPDDAEAILLKAHIAFARDNPAEARTGYASLLEDSDIAVSALTGLANCELREGNVEEARRLLEKAAGSAGHGPQSENLLAAFYGYRLGDAAKAARIWETLLETHPHRQELMVPLAECYAETGETAKLDGLINKCKVRNKAHVAMKYYLQGIGAWLQADHDKALEYLQWCSEAFAHKPVYAYLYLDSALATRNSQAVSEALSTLDERLEVPGVEANLSFALHKAVVEADAEGNADFALQIVAEIERVGLQTLLSSLKAARINLRQGRTRDAMRTGKAILADDPYQPGALEICGRASMRQGDFTSARSYFNKLLQSSEDTVRGTYWLGICALREGRFHHATEKIEPLAKAQPEQLKFQAALYDCYIRTEAFDKARKLAGDLKESDQADPKAMGLSFLAGLAKIDGDCRETADLYGRAITLKPDHLPFRLARASALMECEDYAAASRVLEKAADIFPSNRYLLFKKALCAQLAGKREEAANLYRRITKEHPRWALPLANYAELSLQLPGKLRQATELAKRATVFAPDWGPGHLVLAQCLSAQGNLEQARKSAARARELGNTEAETLLRKIDERLKDDG